MKVITKYVADDGSEWNSATECTIRDILCNEIAAIMASAPKAPVTTSFSNGDGYVQWKKSNYDKIKDALCEIGDRMWPDAKRSFKNCHISWLSRYASDSSIRPLSNAVWALECVDEMMRQWGQPYYASHPSEGNQFAIKES